MKSLLKNLYKLDGILEFQQGSYHKDLVCDSSLDLEKLSNLCNFWRKHGFSIIHTILALWFWKEF